MASGDVIDLIERYLQDREAIQRLKLDPVIVQIIDQTIGALSGCPDFTGQVKEQLQPVITAVIRFLAFCHDTQRDDLTAYLFDPEAVEAQLHRHLRSWLSGACGLTNLVIEAQHIAAGRIDLMFSFDGFRFVLELKRDRVVTRENIAAYLRQAAAYQATDIAVSMLIVLDRVAGALPGHMRDNVWVDRIASIDPGGTERYVLVVRVPGNRTTPSQVGA